MNPAGAGGPGSKALFRRLRRKRKLMGLETEALLFEGCRLWPEARDSGFQELQQLVILLLLRTPDTARGSLLPTPPPKTLPQETPRRTTSGGWGVITTPTLGLSQV